MEILASVLEIQKFLKRRKKVLDENPELAKIPEAEKVYSETLPPNIVIVANDTDTTEVYIQTSAGT